MALLDLPYTVVECELDEEEMRSVEALCIRVRNDVRSEVIRRSLPPAMFEILLPCNVLIFVDVKFVHLLFTSINVGGLASLWFKKAAGGILPPEKAMSYAKEGLGLADPTYMLLPCELTRASVADVSDSIKSIVLDHVAKVFSAKTRPRTIPGYEVLQPVLDRFSDDHPDWEKNVFIAMRFRPQKQFQDIHGSIKQTLSDLGLKGLRSDDRVYPLDGDLWSNICVYMMGCKYGLCVFEEIDEREFNPNVPLEYGFMRAMNRQVLLLKDIRMPKLPSDMTGKLYRTFDSYNIELTINEQVRQWAERDLGLVRH